MVESLGMRLATHIDTNDRIVGFADSTCVDGDPVGVITVMGLIGIRSDGTCYLLPPDEWTA